MAAAAASKPQQSPRTIDDAADQLFSYDEEKLGPLRKQCNLIQNGKPQSLEEAKPFKIVRMSPLASMKMLKHAAFGVSEGTKHGGLSREVMGLLIGKAEGTSIVVHDVFPFNILGEENFVNVRGEDFLPALESLERIRKDRFIGWYHSHPFDVGEHDNCFLSQTDVTTQSNYQAGVTPFWTAVVVDPKRSVAKGRPIMRAFKTFPPAFDPPKDHAPNGASLIREETLLKRNWGPTPQRYYELPIEYFISSAARRLTDSLSRDSLWIRVLSSAPTLESEFRQKIPDRVRDSLESIKRDDAYRGGSMRFGRPGSRSGEEKHAQLKQGLKELSKLAIEECAGHAGQIAKDVLFNTPSPHVHGPGASCAADAVMSVVMPMLATSSSSSSSSSSAEEMKI